MPKNEKEGNDQEEGSKTHHIAGGSVNMHTPMSLWIFLLILAVIIRIITNSTASGFSGTQPYTIGMLYSDFLLQFPGIIILPLIMGAVIGAEVGARSSTMDSALRSGLLNGLYASVIYIIAIVIMYIIMDYAAPQFASVYITLLNSVVIPVLVFLLTVEIFSVISYSRRVDN